MDPKKISNLDPKLRETYERIMGTSSQPVQQTQPPSAATPVQPQIPPEQKPIEPIQKSPEPLNPVTQPPKPISGFMQEPQGQTLPAKEELSPLPPLMQTQTVQDSPLMQNLNINPQEDFTKSPFSNANTSFANPNPSAEEVSGINQTAGQVQKEKKKNKLLPIILIIAVMVFFAIYTVVWAKVFSLF